MCSQFQQQKTMEKNYQGDLADIFRASSSGANDMNTTSSESSVVATIPVVSERWQFNQVINYSSEPASSLASTLLQDFGDPFCNLRDPVFHDLDMMQASSSIFSSSSNSKGNNNFNNDDSGSSRLLGPKFVEEEMKIRPAGNIFSRMLQISPTAKLAAMSSPCNSPVTGASPHVMALNPPSSTIVASNDTFISPSSSKTCLVENSGLQISSPRNTGIKRRKSQAKKVVCIPAAAPANSRQGGEVVPSDLWAWRKYGQKPIKGSPYPRGYYRCSSSKGCSARKQVERSRTDPNMLVITYTSEHNHPWPTQRNALAGSTRSQPTSKTPIKNNNITPTNTCFKDDDQKDSDMFDNNTSNVGAQLNISTSPKVKEEIADQEDMHDHQQRLVEFSQDGYQPALPEPSNHSHEDFFADLAELEADPLNLLFARTLSGDDHQLEQHKKANIDAFNLYDWNGSNNKDGNTTNNNNKDQIYP